MAFVDIADIKIFYTLTGTGEHLLLFPDNHLSSLASAYLETHIFIIDQSASSMGEGARACL